MADIRCPMCSKPNRADAAECAFCGARLKPLIIEAGASKLPRSEPPGEASSSPDADWLSRLRGPEEPESAGLGPAEPADASEDWLTRLRATDPQWDAAAPGPAPAASPAEGPPAEGPDWLGRLRQADSGTDFGPPEGELPDWLRPSEQPESPAASVPQAPASASTDDIPDWLARIREKQAHELEAPADLPAESASGQLPGSGEETPSVGPEADVFDLEKSDWHSGLTGLLEQPEAVDQGDQGDTTEHDGLTGLLPSLEPESQPPAKPKTPAADRPPSQDVFDLEQSGWHSGVTGMLEPREAAGGAGAAEPPAEFELEPPSRAEGTPTSARPPSSLAEEGKARQGVVPGKARELPPPSLGIEPPAPPAQAPVAPSAPLPPAAAPASAAAFEGETLASEIGAGTADKPDWLADLGAPPEAPTSSEPAMPHVPALIGDVEAGPGGEGMADIDLSSIEVPDWLADARSPSEPGAGEARPDLAPATLPAWLEAMRPVETFRSVVEITPEEEQAVEAAGPLAGLRGVLLAEPVVAMPRTASLGAGRLNVTERQYAQAELLRRLVEEEQRESPARTRVRPRLPVLRWAVGGLLMMAVTLSVVLGFPAFPLPGVEPRELAPLVGLIDSLPTDRPALLVFDYEPGYMAEMDAVAGALVTQLMTRGVPIATVSTRPTGPPLAESLITRLAQQHGYVNGQNYVHLGYLSGGTPAVQLFAAAPRDSLLSGFVPAEGQTIAAGWSSPMLAGVQRLSDFAMVGVITAGADSARLWTEQASPWMGGRPLVMVLSAGTEPLVRPYFESLHPQVNGLLTGLPAAVAYEIHNGQPGSARARWNGFGAGMLTVELVIIAGAVYGLGMSVLGMRRPRPKAGGG